MSEFSEVPQSEIISTDIVQQETPQNESIPPKRNFFTSIRDKFKLFRSQSVDQNTPDAPEHDIQNLSHTKLNRRTLLKIMGGTSGLALGGHLIRNVEQINDFVVNQGLAQVNEKLAVPFSTDSDALIAYGEENMSYSGPLRFDIPQQSEMGNTHWTDEQHTILNNIIEGNKQLLDDTLGGPAAWTTDETVLVVRDYVNYLSRHTEGNSIKAAFIEGDMLADSFTDERKKRIVGKTNILCVPEGLVPLPNNQDLLATPEHTAKGYIAHEMTHAYNQDFDYLPTMVFEGIAQMMSLKKEAEYWSDQRKQRLGITREEADKQAYEFMKGMAEGDLKLASQVDTAKSFDNFDKENPALLSRYYDAAGFFFYDWQNQHPDFFKQLRQKENAYYTETSSKPTYEQWQEFGEEIVPGFKDFLNAQPIFKLKRF